ncbi:orexin/Hypocretin receptor type 1 [Phlebotomus argentipes]|uniref:orexin/Hypocretin receptor type 1 n=1 Tax=Phlebotomus argentipes TaxID=94469 RepID=UPI002892D8E6|nr:orexin/Hypocretin receptor type 1 [Phlebotomus argentipes]
MVNSRADLETELAEEIPEHWLAVIAHYVLGFRNDTVDFTAPILKPVAVRFYPLFILQYGLLLVIGLLSNIAVIAYIMHYKLFHDATHSFIVNLAFCHFVQCSVVLPITLMVLLIQNWIFGQFLCFFLPLLQDIPLHVAIITHLLIAWDRMRWLMDPLRARLPAFVCSCATWLAGMVIALPYPIYTTYLDLGLYMKQFRGVGICAVNLVDDMQEYMRGLFVIMYCAPVTILSYLYIRTSRELREPDGPLDVLMFEARVDTRNTHQRSSSSSTSARAGRGNTYNGEGSGTRRPSLRAHQQRSYDLYDAELDVCREKRTQRFLGAMAAVHVICVCPLMIMRLARMALVETYDNATHFDLTYLMFVWMAFLPTAIFPWIYGSWVLTRPVKERLRGYFRLSSRRSNNSIPKAGEPRLSTTEDFVSQDVTTEISHIQESNYSRHGDSFTRKHSRSRQHRRSSNSEGNSMASRGSRSNSVGRVAKRDSNASSELREVSPFNERKSALDVKPVASFAYRKSSFLLDTNSTLSNDPSFPGSTSTLEHDLEIIDLLERERSMDIQEMLQREAAMEEQSRAKPRMLPEISPNRGLVTSPQLLASSRGSTRRVKHRQLAKDIDRRDLAASRARRARRTNWLKSTN